MAALRESNNSSRESIKLHKAIINIALIAAAFLVCTGTVRAAEWQYDGVSRVVAIADIHGAYDAAVSAMQAADVIDESLAWQAGDAHLVIVGDILDRGPDSRDVMDLLMRPTVDRGGKEEAETPPEKAAPCGRESVDVSRRGFLGVRFDGRTNAGTVRTRPA